MARLRPGDPLPDLTARDDWGQEVGLVGALMGEWGAVLFDHGDGCPHCAAQRQDFERHAARLHDEHVRVVVLQEEAPRPPRRWPWSRPRRPGVLALHGAEVARLLHEVGEDVDEAGARLHSTAALVRPDRVVALALYAGGARGHLSALDALGYVRGHR